MNSAPRISASSNIPFSTITVTMTENRVQLASTSAARWKIAGGARVVVVSTEQQVFDPQRHRARLEQLVERDRRLAAGGNGGAATAQLLEVALVGFVAVP